MTTILHISSSSNLQTSNTRRIGTVTVDALKKTHANAKVITRDLVKDSVPHISATMLGAMFGGNADAPELALSKTLVDELFQSDVLVIEAPMYNFGIPSVLKAWIDHIARAGITFKYSATGVEGLVVGKKAIIVLSSGGVYTDGPMKAMEHNESYLRAVLGFIGITDIQSVYIEGVAYGPDKAAEALAAATVRAEELAQKAA